MRAVRAGLQTTQACSREHVPMALNQINAVILVGGPGQSSLREIAGHPVSLLPIPGAPYFLYAWLEILMKVDAVNKVDVLTGRPEDIRVLTAATSQWDAQHLGQTGVYADHENHRGTAGALKDFVTSLEYTGDLLVIEGNRIPPHNPNLLFHPDYDRQDVIGSLGRTADFGPSGMILMKKRMLDLVPEIGFFDLKEQLIPRALERGERIIVRQIGGEGERLSDAESYKECVRQMGRQLGGGLTSGPWVSEDSQVHPSALVGKGTLIAGNARIEREVVTENSVILDGVVIGHNSLVVDSIIKQGSHIPSDTKVIRGTVYKKHETLVKNGTGS